MKARIKDLATVSILVILILVAGCIGLEEEQTLRGETVDTAGDVGLYTSIALDSNDNPHISYYVLQTKI